MYTAYECIAIDSTYPFNTIYVIDDLYDKLRSMISDIGLNFSIKRTDLFTYPLLGTGILIQDPLLDFNMFIKLDVNETSSKKEVSITYNSTTGYSGSRRLSSPYMSSSSTSIYFRVFICNIPTMKLILMDAGTTKSGDINSFPTLSNLESYPSYGHLLDSDSNVYDFSYGLFEHKTNKLSRLSISTSHNVNLISYDTLSTPTEEFTTSLMPLPIFIRNFSSLATSPVIWLNNVKDVYFSQQGGFNVGKKYSNDIDSYIAIFPNVLYKT